MLFSIFQIHQLKKVRVIKVQKKYSLSFLLLILVLGISCGSGTNGTSQNTTQSLEIFTPIFDEPILLAETETSIKISAFVPGSTVELFRFDDSQLIKMGDLTDDGTNGDKIAGDHVYTIQIKITESHAEAVNFRIAATSGDKKGTSDISIPVVHIPSLKSIAEMNQAMNEFYQVALDAKQLTMELINSNENSLDGTLEKLTENFLKMFNIFEAITNLDVGFLLLGAASDTKKCNKLIDLIVENPDDPRAEPLIQGLIKEGFFKSKEELKLELDSLSLGLGDKGAKSAKRIHLRNLLLNNKGSCLNKVVFEDVPKIAVKGSLSPAQTLTGEGLSGLYGVTGVGKIVVQESVGIGSGKLIDWFTDSEGTSRILIGETNSGEEITLPSTTHNFVYSFGNDHTPAYVQNFPVYSQQTKQIKFSPGDFVVFPEPPNGLIANAVSPNQIDLFWTPPTESRVVEFNVYREGVFLKSERTPFTSDAGLIPSTQYCYTVSAVDLEGNESGQSTKKCAITLSSNSPPQSPNGVTAIPADQQITIYWNDIPVADSYNLYWNTTSPVTKTTGNQLKGLAGSPFIHNNLTNGVAYYYVVTSVNTNGESSESDETYAVPASPTQQKAWGTPTQISNSVPFSGGFFPNLSFNEGGDAIVVWQQPDGTTISIWANRYETGKGWGVPTLVENNDFPASSPQVAMDNKGNSIVVWSQSDGTTANIWANRYETGKGWGNPIVIENAPVTANFPRLAMDKNGNAIVVWKQRDSAINRNTSVWTNRYDITTGWGNPTLIDGDPNVVVDTQIAMDSNGNATVIWYGKSSSTQYRIYSKRYEIGIGWGNTITIDINDSHVIIPARVGMDENGNSISVWGQGNPFLQGNEGKWANRYEVGKGWENPIRLSEKLGTCCQLEFAMDINGNAMAVWNEGGIKASFYDIGIGWRNKMNVPIIGGGYSGTLGMDNMGNSIILWTLSGGGIGSTRFEKTIGWGSPILIHNIVALESAIAVYGNGNAVAVWRSYDGASEKLLGSKYE